MQFPPEPLTNYRNMNWLKGAASDLCNCEIDLRLGKKFVSTLYSGYVELPGLNTYWWPRKCVTPWKELASFVWSPRGTLGGLIRKSSWGSCHAVNSLHSPSRRKAGRQCPSEGKAKHSQVEIGFLQETWGKKSMWIQKTFLKLNCPRCIEE